jgi:hypothetical protein
MRVGKDGNAYEARLRQLHSDGQITTDEYFRTCQRLNAKNYLAQMEPRRQSGHGGDLHYWRHVRSMILEAVYHDGIFIDIGCANGHPIESLSIWMRKSGVELDFYGLELSPDLHALAIRRLPEWTSHLFVGNGLNWKPPFPFDYVYTMVLPDIPPSLRQESLANLYGNCLKRGGRLILGPHNDRELENEIIRLGFPPSGYCEKTVAGDEGRTKRIVWINKA